MNTYQFIPPTPEQRQEVLHSAGLSERLVRSAERERITSISRSQTWKLEREGKHPKCKKLGANSVAWVLSDLLWFIYNPVQRNHTPLSHSKGATASMEAK
ncbi:AlpA family phage regulatory protein [uncultured Shewanella sp.]|uniref:AlpA family phage regulatory protein n=1 Tax=uncultured Shewanella sp. TaxID=173975 RepID=UPI00262B3301|nr:AlpA family phage regulatory protein [uncultured Shewanella sp.]